MPKKIKIDLMEIFGFNIPFIGYIMTGSFKGRGNQYTLADQDFVLLTARHW